METSVAIKQQCVFPPRAIAYLKGVLPGLTATINLPRQFHGIGALLAVDPEGNVAIDAVLMPPSGPRAQGFRPRAKLTKESIEFGHSGNVLLIQC